MDGKPIPPRRRKLWRFLPRYSIRLLVCLLTGICLWLGIVGYRARNQRRLVEEIRARGGENSVSYVDELPPRDGAFRVNWPDGPEMRDWFYDLKTVVLDKQSLDLLPRLGACRNLQSLILHGATDDDLAKSPRFPRMWLLGVDGTITDDGLARLREKFPNLIMVQLEYTQVSDEALLHLAHLTKLELVLAAGTKITETGVKRLQESLPDCEVSLSDSVQSRQ